MPALDVIDPVASMLADTVTVDELVMPLTVNVPAEAVIEPITADCT